MTIQDDEDLIKELEFRIDFYKRCIADRTKHLERVERWVSDWAKQEAKRQKQQIGALTDKLADHQRQLEEAKEDAGKPEGRRKKRR